MTDMGGNQNLFIGFTRQEILAVVEATIFQSRVNDNLVLVIGQSIELTLAQAKPPSLIVIGGSIRNPFRSVRNRVDMRPEFVKRNFFMNRRTITHDVKIAFAEIYDFLTV